MLEHSLWFLVLREHAPALGQAPGSSQLSEIYWMFLKSIKSQVGKTSKNVVWPRFRLDGVVFLLFASVGIGASYTSYTLYFTRSILLIKNKQNCG